MNTMKIISVFVTATLAGVAAQPASAGVAGIDGPWSILVTGTVPSQVTEGYHVPLLVSSLDGETPSGYTTFTKPGKKQLLLETPRKASDRAPSHKRLELEMAPCMRYYVAGKKSSELSLRWSPEVFRAEPIGECFAEFKLSKQADTSASSPIPVTK